MEVSPYKFNQPGGEVKPDYVHVAPCPDIYGGKFTDKMYPNADMGALYAQPIEEICQKQLAKGQGVAAFIAESLQSYLSGFLFFFRFLNKLSCMLNPKIH